MTTALSLQAARPISYFHRPFVLDFKLLRFEMFATQSRRGRQWHWSNRSNVWVSPVAMLGILLVEVTDWDWKSNN